MLLPPTIEQLDRVKLDLFFVVCNEKLLLDLLARIALQLQ